LLRDIDLNLDCSPVSDDNLNKISSSFKLLSTIYVTNGFCIHKCPSRGFWLIADNDLQIYHAMTTNYF